MSYKCKNMQVFNSCTMNMPHEFGKEEMTILVAGNDGAGNDSYHRWYPAKVRDDSEVGAYCQFRDETHREAGRALNEWLTEHGMVEDVDDKYFHVLIFVSW